MNPDAINIAIADHCGWDGIFKDDDGIYCGHQPNKPRQTEWCVNTVIPNYRGDLSAMHEVEKTLTYGQRRQNTDILELVVGGPEYKPATYATAAQRAEAFLRTFGKWKEGA